MLDLKIITVEGIAYSGKVDQATIPTTDGEITVLPNHVPLVSELAVGTLRTKGGEGGEKSFKIGGGVLEVRKGSNVVVLTDRAEE